MSEETKAQKAPSKAGKNIKLLSSQGGEFDCYLAMPKSDAPAPAVVLASAVHGVDADICAIADEFAGHGFIAVAPDLFWRSLPGPLPRTDHRSAERSQPRLQKLKAGEIDLVDTLAYLKRLPEFNGNAAIMGFCYGGPYAIIGPKRLGYAAGISCHGSQFGDFVGEIEGVRAPMCLIWGDKDHLAPPPVLDAYRAIAARMNNVDLHIFPGVLHGYMLPAGEAFDKPTRDFSMARALAILDGLRSAPQALSRAS